MTSDLCVSRFRKLEDVMVENKEMSQTLGSKETSIRCVQQQLEEKTLECSVLSRQLQQALDDAQKQVVILSHLNLLVVLV